MSQDMDRSDTEKQVWTIQHTTNTQQHPNAGAEGVCRRGYGGWHKHRSAAAEDITVIGKTPRGSLITPDNPDCPITSDPQAGQVSWDRLRGSYLRHGVMQGVP